MKRIGAWIAAAACAAALSGCARSDPSTRFARLPDGSFNEGTGRIVLEWQAVDNPELSGYFVYLGKRKGGRKVRLNGSPLTRTSVTIEGLAAGERYYFAITTASNTVPRVESPRSPEIERIAGR